MVHRNGHGSLISKWSLFPRPHLNIWPFTLLRNVPKWEVLLSGTARRGAILLWNRKGIENPGPGLQKVLTDPKEQGCYPHGYYNFSILASCFSIAKRLFLGYRKQRTSFPGVID
jgi:hypothetical protein